MRFVASATVPRGPEVGRSRGAVPATEAIAARGNSATADGAGDSDGDGDGIGDGIGDGDGDGDGDGIGDGVGDGVGLGPRCRELLASGLASGSARRGGVKNASSTAVVSGKPRGRSPRGNMKRIAACASTDPTIARDRMPWFDREPASRVARAGVRYFTTKLMSRPRTNTTFTVSLPSRYARVPSSARASASTVAWSASGSAST